MIHWNLKEKKFNLKYNWKISRNESTYKNLFFAEISDGRITAAGEASPNVRYGETPERLHREFNDFLSLKPENIYDLPSFSGLLAELKPCNALRFALEAAFIHFTCRRDAISLYDFLDIPAPGAIFTSYTIPIIPPEEVKEFIERYALKRFKSLKIKINMDGLDLIEEVIRHYPGPLRIDANEAWKDTDALMRFLEKLKGKNIEFIEQPFPHDLEDAYIYLKKHSPFPIMGDESITANPDMEKLARQFHGINMKLMKAGGYIHGRDILFEAKKLGLKTMIGCMIETTLGISCGMHLCGLADYADLDGAFVIGEEPFGLVKETDGQLEFVKSTL